VEEICIQDYGWGTSNRTLEERIILKLILERWYWRV
jgi:hypothetical protein